MSTRIHIGADSPIRTALEVAAKRFADDLADVLERAMGAPERYDQYNSPLGKRKHLRLAREGVLPSAKEGRQVFVTREDMDRYIASHARAKSTATTPEDELAEAIGLGKVRRGA